MAQVKTGESGESGESGDNGETGKQAKTGRDSGNLCTGPPSEMFLNHAFFRAINRPTCPGDRILCYLRMAVSAAAA